jgi:diacylglycerol kinase family enzyme
VAQRIADVILNRGSGKLDKQPLVDTIRTTLAAHGVDARVHLVRGGPELVTTAARAAAGDAHVVVAGGGDGTIGTVSKQLVGTGKTLGVLPLGTFNYFARNLRVPLELDAALALMATGEATPIDVGEVNGQVFLNNASIGLYPAVLAKRETIYRRFGRSQLLAYASAALALIKPPGLLNLMLTADGQLMSRRTPLVFIGTNAYQLESFAVSGGTCLRNGRLVLYVTRPLGPVGLLRLAGRALAGRLRGADEFEVLCAGEVTVALRRRRIGVAMDGEVKHLDAPLRFALRRGALSVIAGPPASEPA